MTALTANFRCILWIQLMVFSLSLHNANKFWIEGESCSWGGVKLVFTFRRWLPIQKLDHCWKLICDLSLIASCVTVTKSKYFLIPHGPGLINEADLKLLSDQYLVVVSLQVWYNYGYFDWIRVMRFQTSGILVKCLGSKPQLYLIEAGNLILRLHGVLLLSINRLFEGLWNTAMKEAGVVNCNEKGRSLVDNERLSIKTDIFLLRFIAISPQLRHIVSTKYGSAKNKCLV